MRFAKRKPAPVAGLDIEAGSIAATEVAVNGVAAVTASAIAPLDAGVFREGEVADPERLTASLKSLFGEHKISKRVRLGVANQGVVVRTVRLPAIEDPKEMDAAIRFQAQEQVPMPLDQAVLEHQVVGGVAAEEGAAPQVDVVVVAARRDMVSSLLEPVRRAGLEPVGIDLSAFAMIRALADSVAPAEPLEPGQRPTEAALYCNFGDVVNLAVARGRACLFTRVSHNGMEAIGERLVAARGLLPEHAQQWLSYVGLERPVEEIEGDPETVVAARQALEDGLAALLDDLRLSLDYYGSQEGALPVAQIVLGGPGSTLPGLAARVEERLGAAMQIAQPQALAGFDPAAAARLTLAYGLALED